jgi:Neuraminidase (sialidase)
MFLVSRYRWQTFTTLGITLSILLALVLIPVVRGRAAVSLLQLSSDPYTNTSTQHQTEVSPASFAYGSTVVSTFMVGKASSGGGSSNIGWATSSDGGNTWTRGFLAHTSKFAGGLYQRVADPAVTYDAKHNIWMIAFNGFINGNAIAILASLSTNGGMTWSNPISVVNNPGEDLDKISIACDNTATSPFYGHCYTEWNDEHMSDLVSLSTSTDGGMTWGTPVHTANSANGFNGHPLVQPNGNVVVPINKPIYAPSTSTRIMAFTSSDGGMTWSAPVSVTSVHAHALSGSLRSLHIFTAGIDGAGKVYVVWEDCRFESGCTANDLVMTTSSDGIIWSAVRLIPIDPVGSTVEHFIPGLAVDSSTFGTSAHLALTYYYLPSANCSTSTCQLNVGFVSSNDGGSTWTASTQLAGPMTVTWLVNTQWGYMIGDYISTSISVGKAIPVFPVAAAPVGSTLNEAINTVPGGL